MTPPRPMVAVALAALIAGAACAGQGAGTPPPGARVLASGFQVLGGQVGTAAIVRADPPGVEEIELRVRFFTGDRLLGEERDTLPYCPADTDCGWGQSIFGENLSPSWRSVDRVEVDVTAVGEPLRRDVRLRQLRTRTSDGHLVIAPDGVGGTVYAVASSGGLPRTGISFFTTRGERDRLRYSQALFARHPSDEVRAYLYPGRVPDRVRGPDD